MYTHNSNNIPMVSISMLAYNHEKYISQALDGILMQRVDFTYEIVVGEDCSQDNTRSILLQYKKRYPDKIKLILHDKNVGMKNNGNAVRRQCIGKYCAVCEGDDYWVDPYKLKKQVEFLESHPEYIATSHRIQVVDKNGNPINGKNMSIYCQDKIYTIKHAEKGILPGQSATFVYRNIFANNPKLVEAIEDCKANGDMKLALCLALHGDIYCFEDVMSHYRWVTNEGDSWSARIKDKNLNLYYFNSYLELSKLAKRIKNVDMDYTSKYLSCGLGAFVEFIKRPKNENLKIFIEIYKKYNDKKQMILYILKKFVTLPFRKIKKLSIFQEFYRKYRCH